MTSPPSSSISPLDQQQHQHNSYSEHLTSINGKNSLQGAGKVQKIENTNSSDFMTIIKNEGFNHKNDLNAEIEHKNGNTLINLTNSQTISQVY